MQSLFLTTILLALCAAQSVLSIPLQVEPDARASDESKLEVTIKAEKNLAHRNAVKSEHVVNNPSKTPVELNDDENWIEVIPLQRKIAKRAVAKPAPQKPPSPSVDNQKPKRKNLINYVPKNKRDVAPKKNRPVNKVTISLNPKKERVLPPSFMFHGILVRPGIGARH